MHTLNAKQLVPRLDENVAWKTSLATRSPLHPTRRPIPGGNWPAAEQRARHLAQIARPEGFARKRGTQRRRATVRGTEDDKGPARVRTVAGTQEMGLPSNNHCCSTREAIGSKAANALVPTTIRSLGSKRSVSSLRRISAASPKCCPRLPRAFFVGQVTEFHPPCANLRKKDGTPSAPDWPGRPASPA